MSGEPEAPRREQLATRPGWAQLRAAGAELHAAEVLLGDPVAETRTALVHLRGFWTAALEAARAAGSVDAEADASAWLQASISGLDRGQRAQLRRHLAKLGELETRAQGEGPARGLGMGARRSLRMHARAARELFEALEPVIGGVPLRRRRLRRLWGSVGVVLLLGPLAGYYALTREIEGEGPWRATYFTDRELDKELTVLREAQLDHDWKKDAPLEAVPPDKFSVRWDSCLVLDEATTVVLQLNANDGARVLVDGELAIDAWDKDPKTRKRGSGSAAAELEAGVHHLRVEYFESMGSAHIKLAASFEEEQMPAPLPPERLRYPGDRLDEEDPCAAARGEAGQ